MKIVATDTTMIVNHGKLFDYTYYIDVFNNKIISSYVSLSKHSSNGQNLYNAYKALLNKKINK